MAGIDELEDVVDQEIYEEQRDALVLCLDALAPLKRDDRRHVMKCIRDFFSLPAGDS